MFKANVFYTNIYVFLTFNIKYKLSFNHTLIKPIMLQVLF